MNQTIRYRLILNLSNTKENSNKFEKQIKYFVSEKQRLKKNAKHDVERETNIFGSNKSIENKSTIHCLN